MQEQFFRSVENWGKSRVLLEGGGRARITAGADLELGDQSKRRLQAILTGLASLPLPDRSVWIELSDVRGNTQSDLYPFQISGHDVTYPDWPLLDGVLAGAWDQGAEWSERSAVAYWRGPLAGEASVIKEVMGLRRLQLAVASKFDARVDAKLTSLGNFDKLGAPLADSLEGLGLLGDQNSGGAWARYHIDAEGDISDRALSPIALSKGCPIRLGSPCKTWVDIELDRACEIPSVLQARDIGDAVTQLETSGDGRRIFSTVQNHMRTLTSHAAWAGFCNVIDQVA